MRTSDCVGALMLALAAWGTDVSARGYHGHGGSHLDFGFYWGVPLFWGADPYYYDRRPVYLQPPVYVERPPVYTAPPPVWYYCQSPAGYYPYVPQCSQAWLPVDPRTVPPR